MTIRADSLSVTDQNKTMTFSGNVIVTQGAARMRCAGLVVHRHFNGPDHHVVDRFACKPDYLRMAD